MNLPRRQFLLQGGIGVAGLGFGAGIAKYALGQPQPPGNISRLVTDETQNSINRGLDFLAAQGAQGNDGSFGTQQHAGNVAITSLAGLAFLAGGHEPGRNTHGEKVKRAVEFLLSKEDPRTPGYFHNPATPMHGPMYAHGFATLFLAEVHGMIYQPQLRDRLRAALRRAVDLLIRSQNRQGGWRYSPQPHDADLSVTICQIMALRAARNAGFTVPKTIADRCIEYVRSCQDPNTGGFRYQPNAGPPGFARTAAGLVALFSAGIYEGDDIRRGLDFLLSFKPRGGGGGLGFGLDFGMHYHYGHYYAAQAMWIAGGRHWNEWYPAIRDELLRTQQANGSWGAQQFPCSHYTTAMSLIILQIPNGYLPILHR